MTISRANRKVLTRNRAARLSRTALLMMAVAPAAMICGSALGAADTWTGGSVVVTDHWTDAGNWGGTAPVSGADNLVFSGSTQTTNHNDFVGATFNGIGFSSGASSFNLLGNSMHLGLMSVGGANTATAGDIINDSANAQSIGLSSIILDPGVHLISTGNFAATGGQLNISSNITQSKGSAVVFRTVSSNINFTGSNLANDSSANGGILGGWAMIGGTNTVAANFATLDINKNVVAYSGYFNISGNGTLPNDATQNVRIISNVAGAAGNTTQALPAPITRINTLLFAGTDAVTTASAEIIPIGAGNTLVLGQNGGIMNATATGGGTLRNLTIGAAAATGGTLTAGDGINPANITFSAGAVPNAAGYLTINSAITDNGSAPVSVTLTGGYITENNTGNSYSGGTYIISGRVSQSLANTFGIGPVYIFPGGQTNTTSKIANNFFISGNGSLEQPGQALGALRLFGTGATAAVLSGTITLTADAMIAPTNTSTPSITGQITGTGNLTIGKTNGSQQGGVLFIGSTTAAGNKNNYTGDTIIAAPMAGTGNTTLEINAPFAAGTNDNIMPHGLTGSFSGGPTGNVILDGSVAHVAFFDLNGSTQTINGLSSTVTAPANNFITSSASGGVLIIGDSNASGNYGGTIQDGGGLSIRKIGSGTQTFTGSNSYSGDTNINGGTLVSTGGLNSSGNVNINTASASTTFAGTGAVGNIVLAANSGANKANLAPGQNATTGSIATLNANSLTVNGGNILLDLSAATLNDLVAVSGAVNFTAASSIMPNGGTAGTYTVLTSGSTITYGVTPTLVAPAADPLVRAASYTLDTTSDATKIFIAVTGGSKAISWTGVGGSTWDINNATIKSWADATPTAEKFFNNDAVTFGDGAGNRTIAVSGTVLPSSITVNASAGTDYAFNGGVIGGNTNLAKSNGGNLTLTGNNTYAGGTSINGGTLFVGNNGTSGSLGSGAVLDNADLVFARTDAITIANVISGSGNLSIGKAGTNANVTLTAVNNYSGATTVASGSTLVIGATGSIASSSGVSLNNSTIIINAISSTLNLGNSVNVGSGGGLVKYGSMALNGFATTNIALNTTAGGTLTIDINDSSSSIKTYVNNSTFNGGGDFVFTNSQSVPNSAVGGLDTYNLTGSNSSATGNISVSGAVRLQANTSASLTTGNVTVASGAQLFFNAAGGYANNFTIAGVGTQVDTPSLGALRLANGTTLSGNIALSSNATITAGTAAANTATLNGQIIGAGALTLSSGTFTLANLTANASVYGPVAPGSIATIIGSISGRAGLVTVADTNSISHGGLQLQGGTLHLQSFSLAVPNFSSTSAGGTLDSAGGAIVLTMGSDGTNQSFSGSLADGGGSLGILKTGGGTQTFSGNNNTYSGNTTVSGGKLLVTNTANSGTGTGTVTVNSTASLGGTGIITGAVTVNAGGSISTGTTTNTPGKTAATFTIGSTSSLGGTLLEDLTAVNTSDKLVIGDGVTSSVTLAGTLTVTNPNGVAFAIGQSYDLLDFGSETGNFTTFNLPALAGSLAWDTSAITTTGVISVIAGVGPASLTWNNTGGTGDGVTFDTTGQQNWNNGAAPAKFNAGDNVTFNDTNNGHYAVTISGNNSPGSTTVSTTSAYAFSGSGSIIGSGNLTKTGTGSLTISNANGYSGGTIVTTGSLVVANTGALGTGGLTVHTAGTAQLQAGLATAIKLPSVTLDGTTGAWAGKVDITNNKLIIQDSGSHATSLANAKNQAAFALANANSAGIFATGVTAGKQTIVLDNAVEGLASFGSVSTDAGSILIMATFPGDANLDGKVNITDLNILAGQWQGITSAWTKGDFNGSGKVEIGDLNILAGHWQNGVGAGESFSEALASIPAFAGLTTGAVPEPASLALLGMGAAAMLIRRKRN